MFSDRNTIFRSDCKTLTTQVLILAIQREQTLISFACPRCKMIHTRLSLHSHASGFYTAFRPDQPWQLKDQSFHLFWVWVMRLGCGSAGRRGFQRRRRKKKKSKGRQQKVTADFWRTRSHTLLMLEMFKRTLLFGAETTAGCQKSAAADERKYSAHLFMGAGSLSATLVTWMQSTDQTVSSCSTLRCSPQCLIRSECRCRQQQC